MKDRETTARSRELGDELRRVREKAKYSGAALARKLGWSPSRVSRLESGSRGASEVDVATFLAFCHVAGPERDRIVALCKEVYSSTWLRPHSGVLPDELRTLILHEATAETIQAYEPLVVPGLLQTEDYARALFRWAALVPEDGIELRVQARMDRQKIFQRHWTPEFTFFVPEHVLRTPVGGKRIMNDQLLHLALVSTQSRCTVRVVPTDAGPHGVLGGPFRLMDYAEHRPVAYLENHTSSLFLEEPEDVAVYRATLDRLIEIALDGGQSRELLASLASQYDQPEEGNDELA